MCIVLVLHILYFYDLLNVLLSLWLHSVHTETLTSCKICTHKTATRKYLFSHWSWFNLLISYSNFPKKQVKAKTKSNPWMTCGIKISCQHKRELYLALRNSNDPNLKHYYKIYCKILSNVIKHAQILHYNRLSFNSNNKMKTIGSTIKWVTGKKTSNVGIQFLNIDGKLNDNHLTIADSLNNYFLTAADKINTNNINVNNTAESDTNNYLNYLSQTFTTPFLKINTLKTKRIYFI
jgi:hypothetical protein